MAADLKASLPGPPRTSLGYVRVVSLRGDGPQPEPGETSIRVDRANPILGNPFILRHKHDPEARQTVIAQYRRRLERDQAAHGPISQAIAALATRVRAGESLALQCWCAPLPCHGDTLAQAILVAAHAD